VEPLAVKIPKIGLFLSILADSLENDDPDVILSILKLFSRLVTTYQSDFCHPSRIGSISTLLLHDVRVIKAKAIRLILKLTTTAEIIDSPAPTYLFYCLSDNDLGICTDATAVLIEMLKINLPDVGHLLVDLGIFERICELLYTRDTTLSYNVLVMADYILLLDYSYESLN
jgi:hypothetical protein